mgnify:FL=1
MGWRSAGRWTRLARWERTLYAPPGDVLVNPDAASDREPSIDAQLLEAWPRVRLDNDNAAFYRGLLEHRVSMHRCDECGAWHHPPRPMCPRCWSWAITPTDVAGTGTVALVTVLRQGRNQPGANFDDGFVVVAVDLDEQTGLRLTGSVVGTPPTDVVVGQRVELVWPDDPDVPQYPDFRVVE